MRLVSGIVLAVHEIAALRGGPPLSDTARGHDRCRDTATHRFMDPHRWSTRGGYRGVARLLSSWRSVELHHARNPRCRPGTARTWRLVGGCATFLDGNASTFETERVRSHTSFGLVLLYFKGAFLRPDMVYTVTPSGVVLRRDRLHNARDEQRSNKRATFLD